MSNENILRMRLVITETKTKLALCRTAVHLFCKAADAIHRYAKKNFLLKTKISKTSVKFSGKEVQIVLEIGTCLPCIHPSGQALAKNPDPGI
jgi:hypothetical protein